MTNWGWALEVEVSAVKHENNRANEDAENWSSCLQDQIFL